MMGKEDTVPLAATSDWQAVSCQGRSPDLFTVLHHNLSTLTKSQHTNSVAPISKPEVIGHILHFTDGKIWVPGFLLIAGGY